MINTKRILRVVSANNKGWLHYPVVKGIQKTEGVDFNHVAIITEFNQVYEAVFPKARKMHLAKWNSLFSVVKVYEYHLEPEVYAQVLEQIQSQVGRPYSVWQCAMIYFAQSMTFIQKKIESKIWNGRKALICSEFVAYPLMSITGFEFSQGVDSIGMDEIKEALEKTAHKIY